MLSASTIRGEPFVTRQKMDRLMPMVVGRAGDGSRARINDPERTKADILAVATHEFSEKGFSGARIDEIAERTHTSKRMIYYYYGGKEALYRAVLEACYRRIRSVEEKVDLDNEAAAGGAGRAGPVHLRPPQSERRLHSPRHGREHPPRREHRVAAQAT